MAMTTHDLDEAAADAASVVAAAGDDGDNDDDSVEVEEEANTQETFTQQLTQGNELTQLGLDDDPDEADDDAGLSQSRDCHSPLTPIDPLTVPWGRLMPVGIGHVAINDNDDDPTMVSTASTAAITPLDGFPRPTSTDLLPRLPTWACGSRSETIATRSRSPSVVLLNGGGSGSDTKSTTPRGDGRMNHHLQHNYSPTPRIHFLGLKNLLPSDRFNEYVLGRSIKADITAQKLDCLPTIAVGNTAKSGSESQTRDDARRKRHEYVHAMVSNRHCRIYCLLSNINNGNSSYNTHIHTSPSSPSVLPPPDMEVFVEDTSGNGTLINGTTLLRKNERRRIHTGDVICLLNPKLLSKKLRSVAERKMYMSQYSYVFVNLYEQEARHGWGVTSGRIKRTTGGVVNVRAMKCHSIQNHGNDHENCANCSKKSLKSNYLSSSMVMDNCETDGLALLNQNEARSSTSLTNRDNRLGSFLTHSRLPPEKTLCSRNKQRRIEEEYDLRDLLGTGTCGEVRRAIHRRTGEERAVKIISIDGRGSGGGGGGLPGMSVERLATIQAEADILRSLDHPYVVKLFDAYISPGKAIYLVMELIRGGDLFDRIVERERYTEVQARRLFRRILAAVHYLHEERGIVHRDLKPENILVVDRRSDVHIKLTDFGLAKTLTAEGLKTFCGTPLYFAPEVLRRRHTIKGDGRYGQEIDCWSLGVILFILLSGSPPFDVSAGFDTVANAKLVFHDDQWNTVSREARDLVKCLLEKVPSRRMSVRDACKHAWMLIDDGDTHCHPLEDPLLLRDKPILSSRNHAKTKVLREVDKREGEGTTNINAKIYYDPPETSCRNDIICPPVDIKINNDFVNLDSRQILFDSTNLATAHEPFDKSHTLLADGEKSVSKAIPQVCDDSQTSPTGSPIQKRQLFDQPSSTKANIDSTCKRISKRDLESIAAAGKSLPPPVINSDSLLVKKIDGPKKKVQSTLFPPSIDPNEELRKIISLPKKSNRSRSGTSTVTPPGTEPTISGLVFQLNKKQKVGGQYISPETRQNFPNAIADSVARVVEKADLSEDELQSDFSEECPIAPGCEKPSQTLEHNRLEKYICKRKMESIDSTASRDFRSGRSVSKSTENDIIQAAEASTSTEEVKLKYKAKKFIQTSLFGKQVPINGLALDVAGMVPVSAVGQSGDESVVGVSGILKGKQRTITSWLVK